MNIVGVDLAAKEKNPTGICSLNQEIYLFTLYSNKDIIEGVQDHKPELIALDAPLIKGKIQTREVDLYLKKYGALLPTIPSMKPLARRGGKMADTFISLGYEVIEVFPTATAKILSICLWVSTRPASNSRWNPATNCISKSCKTRCGGEWAIFPEPRPWTVRLRPLPRSSAPPGR